jgi:hypothetical protein
VLFRSPVPDYWDGKNIRNNSPLYNSVAIGM